MEKQGAKIKLLHIEDDDGDAKEVQRYCRQEFSKENLPLQRACSLQEGCLLLKETDFDVVLLDLHLGDMDGLDNINIIKEQNSNVPVVVFSGLDDTDYALQAIRLGAQEYLVKGKISSRVLSLSILTSIERKLYERRIFHQAYHDELTQLPNRRAFLEYIKPQLISAKRWGTAQAIFFIDVNNFKLVNDKQGHQVGDELLKGIAIRLKQTLRKSDFLARFAGDEYIIHPTSNHTMKKEDFKEIALKITDAFVRPISVSDNEVKTSLSIGVAMYPDNGHDINALIESADKAMYQAKKDNVSFCFA
jgi:diguanylate cyclase (GGDEF)-like protein